MDRDKKELTSKTCFVILCEKFNWSISLYPAIRKEGGRGE
jgi:hypothetical protein